MNKTELERIALDCLERMDEEAKAARQSQDAKIQNIETRVADFERQLTRLSASLQSLRPLTEGLQNILSNGVRR